MQKTSPPKNRWGQFWNERRNGESVNNIAKKNQISVQAVYKALNSKNSTIENLLLTAAKTNRIHIYQHSDTEGFLWGYSPSFKADVYITHSPKTGTQIWYEHEGHCESCHELTDCLWILKTEAKERKINIPKNLDLPADIALYMFTVIKKKFAWNESDNKNAQKFSPIKKTWEKSENTDC